MSKRDQGWGSDHRLRVMTVAHIREREGADCEEVLFLESARFFRLCRSNPSHEAALGLLRGAVKSGRALMIRLAAPESEVIEEVIE